MGFGYLSVWIGVIICLAYLYMKWAFSYWRRNKIPFVEPKIPFGNLQVTKRTEHLSQRLATFYRKHRNNNAMLGLYFFTRPVVLVLDLDLVQHILIKDFQYFQDR